MPATLTFCFPDRASRVAFITGDDATVGRAEDNSIQLLEHSISRRHARLVNCEGRWRLQDLSSKNGVFLEGHRVQETDLPDHAWFRLGDVLCEFETLSDAALAAVRSRGERRLTQSRMFSRQLSAAESVDMMLEQTLDALLDVVQMQRGFILVNTARGWEVSARKGIDSVVLADRRFEGSLTAVERCRTSGQTHIVNAIDEHSGMARQPSVIRNQIASLACVPLQVGEQLVGVVYLDSLHATSPLTELDLEILESLASQAAVALAMAALDASIDVAESQVRRSEAQRRSLPTGNIEVAMSGDELSSGDTVDWDELIRR